jgi:CheY-like chemotaxis protein/two-component sensor histidine kinase
MARLIDDLLDVNRISRNMLELRRETIDLASVIAIAVETSRPLIEQRHHELIVSIPSEPIYLTADSVRLAQVFSNLLNNAALYTRETDSGDKIWLTAVREGDSAVISVRDNGAGIAPDMLPKIFEMFTQVHLSSSSKRGLGIGLSLARRLVSLHGGTIDVRSDGIDLGATFTVRLPIPLMEFPESPSVVEDAAPTLHNSSKRRILFADDNRDVVESFQMMLRTLGHVVETALDGMEALKKADDFRPEVIVLDVGMPRLDGYETAKRIRQRAWARDVVLIAVTGWGNEKDKLRSAEAGFDIHLVKPVDATGIIEAIEQMDHTKAGRATG